MGKSPIEVFDDLFQQGKTDQAFRFISAVDQRLEPIKREYNNLNLGYQLHRNTADFCKQRLEELREVVHLINDQPK